MPLLGSGASDAAVETLFVVAIFGTIAESQAALAADQTGWTYVVAALLGTVACVVLVVRRYLRVTG